MENIIKFSYISVVISYLLSYLKNSTVSCFIPMIINTILLFIYFSIKKNIVFNKKILYLFFGIVFIFVLYPSLTINNAFSDSIKSEIIKNIIFAMGIFFISIFLTIEKKEYEYIKILYVLSGSFIAICYFINFDNFEGIKKVAYIFSNSLRYRYDFGIYHVNAAGQLSMLVIMLSFLLNKITNVKLKIYEKILNLISIIVLLSSSSRNSIFSLIIFFIFYYLLTFKEKIIKVVKNKYLYLIFILSIFVLFIMVIDYFYVQINIGNINIAKIIKDTNRITNLINIQLLRYSNRFMIGFGLINPGTFISIGSNIDNWYLYIFITEGLLGITMIFIIILYMIINIMFDKTYTKEGIIIKSLFISQLFYAFFETSFYYPSMLLCYVFWILCIIYILKKGIIKLKL